MARAICVLSAVTLGTLVPVAAAIGDKLVRDPGSNGLTIAVVLTLGTALSALVSVLVLLPLSVFHKPATIWRVLGLTLLASGFWVALAVLLMHTGPYRLQITTAVVIKYLGLAAFGTTGALAFFMTLFLCDRRVGRAS